MKKQKKINSLIASIAILAVTAGSLTTATFAWFTRGTEATANGFEFTASSASGIQVSTDASIWKSNITAADFVGSPQEGTSRLTINGMEPVSTVTSTIANGEFSFFGATSGDGGFTLSENTADYLVFDLYFLNSGTPELTLSLTDASSVIDGLENNGTSLATRVGFIVQGSSDNAVTALGLVGNVNNYIWEPNSTIRSNSAIGAPTNAVNNAKYDYNGISNLGGGGLINTNRSFLPAGAYTESVATNDIAIGDSPIIATLPGDGYITKIKVFVWMEGQDVDSNNETSAGDVVISLGFDSGDAATSTLVNKTIGTLDTVGGVSTLSVSGAGRLGAVYTAYVFETGVDANNSLNYRSYVSTGSEDYDAIDGDVIAIELDTVVPVGSDYIVVVRAVATGTVTNSATADPVLNNIV